MVRMTISARATPSSGRSNPIPDVISTPTPAPVSQDKTAGRKYGAIAAEVFGILMDLQFWPWSLGSGTELSYQVGAPVAENLTRFFSYHFVSALAWDIPRAVITVTLVVIAGRPVLNALRRARHKAAFVTHIEFEELANVRINHR